MSREAISFSPLMAAEVSEESFQVTAHIERIDGNLIGAEQRHFFMQCFLEFLQERGLQLVDFSEYDYSDPSSAEV